MVLPLAILSAYLIFSVLVGLCGSQRRMGFTGTFLLSLVITPILALARHPDHRPVAPRAIGTPPESLSAVFAQPV